MTKFFNSDLRIRVTCIIMITIMHSQSWHTRGAVVNLNPTCNTEECRKLGNTLLASINKKKSPCSNLYDYVCDQWASQHPRPAEFNVWTESEVTMLQELNQLKKLLESTDKSTPNVEDAKGLFQKCMKLPIMGKSQHDVISQIMTEVGNWPMFPPRNKKGTIPWSVIDDEYITRSAISAIFDFNLILDEGIGRKRILIQLEPLISPYGTIIRSKGWGLLSGHKNHYKNALYKIIESVAPANMPTFTNTTEKDLNDVINFREDLRKIIKKSSDGNFEMMTIKQFQELQNKPASKDDTITIDWLSKFRAIYKNLADPSIYNITDATVVVIYKAYFSNLADLLKKTPKRVIANHIHLYFAERHLALSSDAQEQIQRSFSNEIDKEDKIRYKLPRLNWCIVKHPQQLTLRKMYIAAAFPPKQKADVKELFFETKRLIKQQISESTWLNNVTKHISLEKISKMTSIIGYPEWMSHNSDEPRYSENALDPLQQDIYYLPNKNEMCATAATFQAPLYSLNVPYVIRYGATIAMFGHEVYHAFDRYALKNNCYEGKSWSDTMRKKFKEQVKCFEKQYEEKRLQELEIHGIKNWGVLPDTSSEDIPDVMGIKLAYKGYKEMLKKSNGTCPTLPGFETTSCDQLFFIAFAHSLCTDFSDFGKRKYLLTESHSLPRIRVNGAALNMEEFGTAFGCNPTDPMMTTKRCDVWKN